jgi:Arc/MetJ-type ribon-helix-helix transcriptional regulator
MAGEELTVDLAPEIAAMIRDAVGRGEYGSPREVLEEALRQRQAAREPDLGRLRAAWTEELASGAFKPLDIDGVKQRGRERALRHRGA